MRALYAALFFAATSIGFAPANAQDHTRIAPKDELRVAIPLSNPVLVTRNAEGELSGVLVDVAKALGTKLGLPVRFVPYENAVRYNQSIGKDEWDIAIGPRDLSRTGQLAFSNPFMELDSSYVVRPGSSLRTPEEVDRAGIKVAVAQGSGMDGFLTRTLKSAEIVHLFGGLVSAQEALSSRRVDVYADFAHLAYRVMALVPGATVLASSFNVVRMTIVVPKSNSTTLSSANDFIAEAKRDGLLAEAIKRAGLRGVRAGR